MHRYGSLSTSCYSRGSLEWLKELECYIKELEETAISKDTIVYKGKEVFTREAIEQFLETFLIKNLLFFQITDKFFINF